MRLHDVLERGYVDPKFTDLFPQDVLFPVDSLCVFALCPRGDENSIDRPSPENGWRLLLYQRYHGFGV
jgi:hypothetical protein